VFPDAELVVNDYEQIGESLESEICGAFGWAVSLSANAQIMAVGANKSNDVATEAGKVRIYERVGSTWQQLGSDINGEAQEDEFGTEVSLSANGKILAVGADKNDNNGLNTGYVRIFEYNGSDWQQLGNNIEGENVNDNFGISLDLAANGNIIAVGANGNDDAGDNYGQVKVFEYDGTSWQQLGESINGEAAGDESGKSVSLSWDGKTLAIGAPLNDGNGVSAGHARVFRYNGTTWQQLGGDLNGSGDYDKFGENIKLSADGKILAASKLRDGNGVRIYRFDGASWSQLGSDLTGFYNQINSLELNASGNILSAGSSITFSNNLKGQSKVFGYDGSNWVQMSSDIQGNLASLLGSGIAMSANGLTFAVGAFGGLGYVNSYELVIKPEATDVSVSGNYEVGATLTGSYTYSDGLNTPEYGTTFQWYRSDDDQASNKTAITGATNRTYTLTEDDLEKYISFEVTPGNSNYEGYPAESTPQLFTFEVPAFRYATDKAIGFNDGGYISLNGQSGLDAGDANDNFSIALWLKSTDTNAALFGEFVSGSSRTRNYLTITEGKLAFDQYDPSGGTTIFDTPINTGEWVHVVLVQESGTRKAYVNGVLESTTGSSEAYGGGSPNQFFIGFRGGSSNGSNFTGEMNEVAWWSKTLSASEVADLYQGIIDLNDADLIGYLSFNQSEDENIVADIGNADGVMADGMDAADRVAGVFDNDLVVDENLNDGQVISESLILSTTNPATYTLLDADGAPVIINDEGKLELTEDLNTVNAQYTIRFKVEIQGVEYESTLELEVQDNTSPTLVSATKDSESQITLTFSEPVQIVGADAANFTVEDGNNNGFCVLSLTDGIAEDNQLILGMDDLSSAVSTLTITYDPSTGSIGDLNSNNMVADATGVMITLNQAPTVSSVSITGTIIEGNELTGNYDYSDDENDDEVGTVFKWYRADAANGTNIEAIAGATNSTYTLAEEDHEKYLFFEVIPSDGNSNGVATRSGATYVQYPRITSVSIPQVVVNVDDNVTVTIRANQTGLSLQSGIVNGIAVTGFSDEGDGTYTATYTLKEDHTNRFANDDIPVSFTLVDDNGGVSNTYNDAISQMGDALRVLDVSSAPSVAYQNFEDDGDDWNYTEASETYDLSNVRTYFEVMPQHRNIEGNITSTDDRGPYIIYPQIVDDLVATYDYNSADAPASFNTVTGTSVFEPHASTLQDRLNFGVFMKDRLPYIYFLFDNAQEDPNFRLGGEAAFNVMQEVPWNGYNPIVFFEDQETVGDNANIDFADSLAYYADQGVLKTSFKWAPEANDGMIYGPVVNNLIIDFDSSSIDNRYALYGHLDTFDGTLRPHKTRTDSNEDSELSFELKQSGSAVLVNNPDDGEDIVASTSSLNSPANGSNFLDFYNESGVDIATTRTYTFDAVDLTAGDEKLLSFSYYAKNLSYPDSLFIQVSYNETPDWDSADEEIFLTESADSWTDFEMRIPGDKESIALRIVSKTDDEDDKVSFDHFRVVEIVDEIAPTLAITSSANPASGPFTATFTFSENVTGFDINDISVGNGEASNFNTTSASVYTATITPASDGEVTVDVAADVAEDWIGNANTAATQLSVINDQTAPAAPIVASISTDAGSSATDNLTNDQTLEISGTAEANASIEVFI
ncbi:MAG: hypothetical protein HWE07_14935, partial [Cytophagia bacterium]|nr:hypothetical protein [Cytophagia bacterium]